MRTGGGGPGAAGRRTGRTWPAVRSAMDFNMKKLASDAGIFFTRAVQVRPYALGPARPAGTPAAEPGAAGEGPRGRRSFPAAESP